MLPVILSNFFPSLETSHNDLVMKAVIRLCVDVVARSQRGMLVRRAYTIVRAISPVNGRYISDSLTDREK